jgi:5'-phosphate synthase pdxT subunit
VKIGVLALQGAFIEHQKILEGLGAEVKQVRLPSDLTDLQGLIIPGGESTTIGKLAVDFKLMDPLKDFARTHAVWGTCQAASFFPKMLTANNHSWA